MLVAPHFGHSQFWVLPAEDYWALQLPRPTKRSLSECKIAVWSEQPGFPVGAEVRAAIDKVTAGASTAPIACMRLLSVGSDFLLLGAALVKCGATVDGAARPDFDGAESHRLYLQLLGCTNASKDSFEEGRVWERHNASPEAEERLAAVGGRLWEIEDNDFIVEHSITQTCTFHAACIEDCIHSRNANLLAAAVRRPSVLRRKREAKRPARQVGGVLPRRRR